MLSRLEEKLILLLLFVYRKSKPKLYNVVSIIFTAQNTTIGMVGNDQALLSQQCVFFADELMHLDTTKPETFKRAAEPLKLTQVPTENPTQNPTLYKTEALYEERRKREAYSK